MKWIVKDWKLLWPWESMSLLKSYKDPETSLWPLLLPLIVPGSKKMHLGLFRVLVASRALLLEHLALVKAVNRPVVL